jgi:AcrR family transcriptional regulator
MQSLRDRQKQQRRESMLIAARTLFVERGYSRTTMDAIAELAGVGVATVYTYFTNKEGVFAALARMDMTELKEAGEAALAEPPADPVAAVRKLLDVYIRVRDYISFDVMREFSLGVRQPGPLREVAGWMSDWRVDQLTRALRASQDAGTLAANLPVREAARIICDLLDRYFERISVAGEDRGAYADLKRRIGLLFDDWRASSG